MSSKRVVDLRGKRPGAPKPAREIAGAAPLPLRPPKRVSSIRVRRRRLRIAVATAVFVILAAGAIGISYASYLPQYSVGAITVEGAQAVSATLVRDYVQSIIYDGSHHFLSRANIFLFPVALIEKDVPLEFPRIQSVSLSRASLLSNSVTIEVTEREAAALWCDSGDSCYAMDKSGYIFASAQMEATTSGEYVFEGGLASTGNPIGQTFAPGHVPGLLAFLNQLGQAGFAPKGASVQSDEDFTVPLQAGFSVYASFGEDPSALVNNLELVLSSDALSGQEQNLEYIDLRFGDKVYYKLKGQNKSQTSAH